MFTNFPRFDDGAGIVEEMLRVVKPGGRVLVGSIPDEATKTAYEARTAEVAARLQAQHGPIDRPPVESPAPGFFDIVARLVRKPVEPQIVCYYFRPEDFIALGDRLGVGATVTNIHPLNPYEGYRFNVIYSRPTA